MRILEAGVPAIAIVIALVVLCFYPLTEQKVYEIRKELEQ
jgi:Na+/melibiose symporter-like transporter